ncbi:MAG: hypothetical protein HC871_16970 [Rhizobiales bacterium]|nr:hypothetical protein [Hyphomicrobiales bacterium]
MLGANCPGDRTADHHQIERPGTAAETVLHRPTRFEPARGRRIDRRPDRHHRHVLVRHEALEHRAQPVHRVLGTLLEAGHDIGGREAAFGAERQHARQPLGHVDALHVTAEPARHDQRRPEDRRQIRTVLDMHEQGSHQQVSTKVRRAAAAT